MSARVASGSSAMICPRRAMLVLVMRSRLVPRGASSRINRPSGSRTVITWVHQWVAVNGRTISNGDSGRLTAGSATPGQVDAHRVVQRLLSEVDARAVRRRKHPAVWPVSNSSLKPRCCQNATLCPGCASRCRSARSLGWPRWPLLRVGLAVVDVPAQCLGRDGRQRPLHVHSAVQSRSGSWGSVSRCCRSSGRRS